MSRRGRGNGCAGWAFLGMILIGVGCAPTGPSGLRISLGGAQIPVELVQSWLGDAQPARFSVVQVSPVYLSQHGFENLARGECDIACTDRLMTPRDKEKFGDRAVCGQRVAFYGYALYVHADNPLDAVFSRHLRLIFQRRIKDWKELGGEQLPNWEGPIHLYGPEKGSRGGQILAPIANIWFAEPTWEVFQTDAEIMARVAEDPYGLGFASIGYDDQRVRYLGLRMERRSQPSFPSLEEIESERYGLAKVIYLFYIDPPSPPVQAVLDQLFGEQGRAAIESTEIWAIPRERAAVPPLP